MESGDRTVARESSKIRKHASSHASAAGWYSLHGTDGSVSHFDPNHQLHPCQRDTELSAVVACVGSFSDQDDLDHVRVRRTIDGAILHSLKGPGTTPDESDFGLPGHGVWLDADQSPIEWSLFGRAGRALFCPARYLNRHGFFLLRQYLRVPAWPRQQSYIQPRPNFYIFLELCHALHRYFVVFDHRSRSRVCPSQTPLSAS